jgi:multidrug transporter EmrE-like cation transporter
MQFVCLAIAIVAEVVGTSALKASNGFTVWQPSVRGGSAPSDRFLLGMSGSAAAVDVAGLVSLR